MKPGGSSSGGAKGKTTKKAVHVKKKNKKKLYIGSGGGADLPISNTPRTLWHKKPSIIFSILSAKAFLCGLDLNIELRLKFIISDESAFFLEELDVSDLGDDGVLSPIWMRRVAFVGDIDAMPSSFYVTFKRSFLNGK